MLVISDLVSLSSQYGRYRHDITLVEYTAKLDAYIMASLAKTRDVETNTIAKFELTDESNGLISAPNETAIYSVFWLPSFIPNTTYYTDTTYTFSQVSQSKLIYERDATYIDNGPYINCPTVFRIYDVENETYSSWYEISNESIDITFDTVGNYYIEYGFQATQSFISWYPTTVNHTAGYYPIFRFYITVLEYYQLTMWDVLDSIRSNVSKGGGIESEYYYEDTRIFDIDSSYETYLKSVEVPQMYLEQATARQMLIFALSYINALPRLEYNEDGLDNLTLEKFNLSTGDYTKEDIVEQSGHQNINQIGTRSYSPLNQVLPNNMDEPTTYAPTQDGLMQVRADNLQITDSSFSIKLPKEIYTPKELKIYVPKITITGNPFDVNPMGYDTYDIDNIEIDLTHRLINIEEWKLKYVTDNFPSITTYDIWDTQLGLRNNMTENLYWELGAKKIHLSDVYGTLVNRTLFQNVIKIGIYEYLMLNMPEPTSYNDLGVLLHYIHNFDIDLDFLADTEAYKDLRFRFSYLTIENLVTKQDKEDLSQIDFYSEMRQNQDESIINAVRSSRKNYGNLQRTGNKAFSFQKLHYSLLDQYTVGLKDSNDYTITHVTRYFYGLYFMAEYFATKYHNRESRQTIVDQTYRWRDNYTKNVFNRHENYSDYITIYPPTFTTRTLQHTKIYSKSTTIGTFLKILLGDTITDFQTRASVAFVRTDGMFKVDPETYGNYYALAIPVSAYPVKNGLAFTFGFDNNQVAGDGLVLRGANWYNQAVRYTDDKGRFTKLGFSIKPSYELDSDDFETYPKITKSFLTSLSRDNYFYCGGIDINEAGADALVIDKDPLTNFKLTYQLNAVSYNVGQYVFGQALFNDNLLVNNPNGQMPAYLYLYEDGTVYELFDDLNIKSGYATQITLDNTYISYSSITDKVTFSELVDLTDVTSWAIGNADGELYIACNEGLNGFLVNQEHFRYGVKEIGYKSIHSTVAIPDYEISINIPISLGSTLKVPTVIEISLSNEGSMTVNTDILHIYNKVLNFENEGALSATIKVIDIYPRVINFENTGQMEVSIVVLNVYPVAIDLSNTGSMPVTVISIDVENVAVHLGNEMEMTAVVDTGTRVSSFKTTDPDGLLPYDYASWVDEGGLIHYAGTLFDPDDYSIGDILMVDADWTRGLWRISESEYNELSFAVTVTVGTGSETDISDILSAVQSQQSQLYNNWGSSYGTGLRVDNGTTYTYYRTTGQYVYLEIVFLEN
jgi:hypothetical protein